MQKNALLYDPPLHFQICTPEASDRAHVWIYSKKKINRERETNLLIKIAVLIRFKVLLEKLFRSSTQSFVEFARFHLQG